MKLTLEGAGYPIELVENQFESLIAQINQLPGQKLVVTDVQVAQIYQEQIHQLLALEGVSLHIVPVGEGSKSLGTYQAICQVLSDKVFTRSDTVVAFGGGVIGDLAGYVAATYLRGLHFIQVPTTLLAMVDSSVGGKNGLNFAGLKNQIGSFYLPDLVWIDIAYLQTLEDRQLNNGLAEVIKYGVLCQPELFHRLFCIKEELNFVEIIQLSLETKQAYVSNDLKDKGIRQYLNLGHTIGHGLESLSQNTLNHGEAVAIGMLMMAKASHRLGWAGEAFDQELSRLYQLHGLPESYEFDLEALYQAIQHDKKADKQEIALIIPQAIGHCHREIMSIEHIKQWIK